MARYEVLHSIRKDGELVEEGLIELEGDDAKIALERGVVRALPDALTSGKPDVDETSATANRQVTDGPNEDTSGGRVPSGDDGPDREMVELFGEDLAGDLHRGGYTSVDEVKGASEENLMAVGGVGKKSVQKIRAALGERGATGEA